MGKETKAAVKRLAALLSKKLDREYAETCGYVQARLSLSLERLFSHLLRGEQEKTGVDKEPKKTRRGRDRYEAYWPMAGVLNYMGNKTATGRRDHSNRQRSAENPRTEISAEKWGWKIIYTTAHGDGRGGEGSGAVKK